MLKLLIFIFISKAVFLRDKSIISSIYFSISKNSLCLLDIEVIFLITGCLVLLGMYLYSYNILPKPDISLHTGINKLFAFLYNKRLNLTISFGGFIMLILPMKTFMYLLGLMHYFPLVSAIYVGLFTAVSLLCEKKTLPDALGFIIIMTSAFIFAFAIQQCNVQDLCNLFLNYMTSSGLLLISGDPFFNTNNKLVLFADRQGSSRPVQQENNSQNNVNQPSSDDHSINTENEKIRLENTYNSDMKKYVDSKSLLESSVSTFTRYWNKTKNDLFNQAISFEVTESRIEEAKKKCSLLEKRTTTTVNYYNEVLNARASLEAWHIRNNLDASIYENSPANRLSDHLIEKAKKQSAEFRDSNWTFNK